jgi:ABC-type multidrug transport system fused ATPase/permease subunit
VSRVIADVDQFADGLLMGFTQFFTGVMTILGTLIFMITINAKITLAVVVITPLSFLVASFIARKTFSMFKLQSETRGEQTALIDEMIGGQKVVKAYGYEDEAVRKFDEINERLQKYSLKAIFFSSITNPSTRFVNSLVYASVAIVGAFSAINGGITVGQLSSFLSYASILNLLTRYQALSQSFRTLLHVQPEYLNLLKKTLRFLMLKTQGLLKRLTEQLILMMYAFPMYLTGSLLRTSIFMSRRDRE